MWWYGPLVKPRKTLRSAWFSIAWVNRRCLYISLAWECYSYEVVHYIHRSSFTCLQNYHALLAWGLLLLLHVGIKHCITRQSFSSTSKNSAQSYAHTPFFTTYIYDRGPYHHISVFKERAVTPHIPFLDPTRWSTYKQVTWARRLTHVRPLLAANACDRLP
jgi:hypothetical protein